MITISDGECPILINTKVEKESGDWLIPMNKSTPKKNGKI
jgi:hypothetical protein